MNACCDGTRLFDSNVETEANHFAAFLLQSSELPILCPIFSFDLDRWKWTIVMRPILFSAIRQIVVKFAWHWRRPKSVVVMEIKVGFEISSAWWYAGRKPKRRPRATFRISAPSTCASTTSGQDAASIPWPPAALR